MRQEQAPDATAVGLVDDTAPVSPHRSRRARRWLSDRRERRRDQLEAFQLSLVAEGVMCPVCRHVDAGVGPMSDNASRRAGVCGALVDAAGFGREETCDCRNLFHGH